MAGIGTYRRSIRTWAGKSGLGFLAAILLASGCATYRVPPGGGAIGQAQRRVCDEFARGEVARLGETVPMGFAKGFLIGLVLDVERTADAVYFQRGDQDLDHWPPPGERSDPEAQRVEGPEAAWLTLPWSLIGGVQLARDAARTNEDVYTQAIQVCTAPILLTQELGPMNARVATSLELLASCYAWQLKYAQAEPLRRQALAIWEAVFGPNDSRVATALEEYATVLRQLHRGGEADALIGRADAIRAQLVLRAPAITHEHSPGAGCDPDSPLSVAIFVLCRGIRHGATGPNTP